MEGKEIIPAYTLKGKLLDYNISKLEISDGIRKKQFNLFQNTC